MVWRTGEDLPIKARRKENGGYFTNSKDLVAAIDMSLQQLVPICWLVHVLVCHFLLRHIRNNSIRATLTLLPCMVLTYVGCRDLPPLSMSSIIVVSIYWMMSIRIIYMIVFSPQAVRSFYSFILQLFWNLFPVIPSDSKEKQWPIFFDLVSGITKLILNHWIFRWLINCEASENHARSIMVAFWILMSSHMSDIQIAFVRLVTRDRYTLLSISNYPLFSQSLREFWGRRYNRLTSTVFNESIFKPIKQYSSSPVIASLVTFIISGLLHAHIVLIDFNGRQSIWPTFGFFFLHGILCCAESYWRIRLPAPVGWLVTHLILFFTLPLCMSPYTRQGPAYFARNPPPFLNASWIPKLPIPNACLA